MLIILTFDADLESDIGLGRGLYLQPGGLVKDVAVLMVSVEVMSHKASNIVSSCRVMLNSWGCALLLHFFLYFRILQSTRKCVSDYGLRVVHSVGHSLLNLQMLT